MLDSRRSSRFLGVDAVRESETFSLAKSLITRTYRNRAMAKCAYCQAETEKYDGGDVPVCIECQDRDETKRKPFDSEHQIRNALHDEIWAATERAWEASEAFIAITGKIPSGIPHPDGVQRIRNASHDLSCARAELMRVHNRIQDYLIRGIVPEDLKPCR